MSDATDGIWLSAADLSAELGLAPEPLKRRVLKLIEPGDRKRVKGVYLYRVRGVCEAYAQGTTVSGGIDSVAELGRQRKAQADLLELELERKRKGTVGISDVRSIYGVVANELRRALDSIARDYPGAGDVLSAALRTADEQIETWAEKMGPANA